MSPEQFQPRAIYGPVGIEQIFCFSRLEPLLKFSRGRRFWIAYAILVIGLLLYYWQIFRQGPAVIYNFLLYYLAPAWVFSEAGAFLLGAMMAGSALNRWRSAQRIPEIYLTEVRPLTIVQLMLVRIVRNSFVIFATIYGLFAIFVLAERSLYYDHNVFLFPYFLGALNAHITLVAGAWIFAVIAMGSPHTGAAWGRFFAAGAILGLQVFLLAALCWISSWSFHTAANMSLTSSELGELALTLGTVAMGFSWMIKLLFTRAYAARVEEVVFPGMEF